MLLAGPDPVAAATQSAQASTPLQLLVPFSPPASLAPIPPTLHAPEPLPDAPLVLERQAPLAVEQIITDFQDVSTELLTNMRADRGQVEEIIQYLWDRARLPQPDRVFIEQLVSALSIKTEISASATKLLEAKAKLLAAGKNTVLVQQNVGGNAGLEADLDRLLEQKGRS